MPKTNYYQSKCQIQRKKNSPERPNTSSTRIQNKFEELMLKHHDVFSKNDQDIGKAEHFEQTNLAVTVEPLNDGRPVLILL